MATLTTSDGTYNVQSWYSAVDGAREGASCSDCDAWDDMDLGPVVAVVTLDESSWYVCRAHLDALREESEAFATR